MKLRTYRIRGFYPYTHLGLIVTDGILNYWLGWERNGQFVSEEDSHHAVSLDAALDMGLVKTDGLLKHNGILIMYRASSFKAHQQAAQS